MNLAAGVLCLWLGSACLWVAHSGLDNSVSGWSGIWQTILHGVSTGDTSSGSGSGPGVSA